MTDDERALLTMFAAEAERIFADDDEDEVSKKERLAAALEATFGKRAP